MVILGLDIATKTGFAFSKGRTAADIYSGSFKGAGDNKFRIADSLEDLTHRMLKEYELPEFCVIEQPLGASPNPSVLAMLNLYYGSVKAVVRGYGVPCVEVADSTWRQTMYGFGRRKGWKSKDWKNHAKFQCEEALKLSVKNADEAEAVMISQYGFYTQRYRQMLDERKVA